MKQSAIITSLKSLVWLSPILIVMGTTAGLVSGTWDVLPLTLILSGVLVLMLWLVSESNALPGFLGQRSTKVGTNVLVATVAMLVILGFVNFLAVQWTTQIDLTENQLFTLAPQTQQVLKELDEPVQLFFFQTDDSRPNPGEKELLNRYQQLTDQFSYTVVDPQADPALAQRFGVQNPAGEIHLEAGSRQQLVQVLNPEQSLTESQLTNGIVNLFSDRQPTAYFLQGHGESVLDPVQGGLSDARTLLEGEDYRVETLDLAQSAIVPDDADVVIIVGAQQALFETEVDALRNYLETPSGLLVLLDPQADPGLAPLFDDWGVRPINRLIIDPNGQAVGADVTTTLIQTYGEHPITESFGNNYSFFPITQPIELDTQEEIESAPLLISSDVTQAFQVPAQGEGEFDQTDVMQGPLVFGVALNRSVESASNTASSDATADPDSDAKDASDSEKADADTNTEDAAKDTSEPDATIVEESRLVVIGNANFVRNNLVNQQLNGDVFLNTVNWLSRRDDQSLTIRPKEATNRRIVLDSPTLVTIALTAIAILPLLGFGGAVVLWLRRR